MIYIRNDGYMTRAGIQVDVMRFPGGEWKVTLPDVSLTEVVYIRAHIQNSDHILQLLLTVDALRRNNSRVRIILEIPYLPYARQDRVCNRGESLSVAVMAQLINSMGAEEVRIWDCHSDVGVALINNVVNYSQRHIVQYECPAVLLEKMDKYVLVAPDAGAMKKTYDFAKAQGIKEVVCASKVRDTATGKITATSVPGGLEGKHLLVVDDIFDGGFTFLQLGEAIRAQNPASLDLFVTHGIFSKGYEDVKKYYNSIVSTDSFHPDASGVTRPDGIRDNQFYFINL